MTEQPYKEKGNQMSDPDDETTPSEAQAGQPTDTSDMKLTEDAKDRIFAEFKKLIKSGAIKNTEFEIDESDPE